LLAIAKPIKMLTTEQLRKMRICFIKPSFSRWLA
jgi:hypothetical protein